MSFDIRVNNQPFDHFISGSLTRSVDNPSGSYNLTCSALPNVIYPIRVGDFVQILINKEIKCTGYVDAIQVSMSENNHTIQIAGRDNIQDLIDSSVPDSAKVVEGPISLTELCENVINSLGANIKVINQVDGLTDYTEDELLASSSGQTCMDYLTSFARKKQVYLVPDGRGNLVIFRPTGIKSGTKIIHGINKNNNNVKSLRYKISHEGRFNRYKCKSQDNFGFDLFADSTEEGTNINNDVIDSQIRTSRYFEIQAEESMDESQCGQRASEESNIRRTKATDYTCVVQGFEQNDGRLWDFGTLVTINDDYAGIKGTMLSQSVTYDFSITNGSTTSITFVPPDGYLVKAELPKADNRKVELSPQYENQEPPPVSGNRGPR